MRELSFEQLLEVPIVAASRSETPIRDLPFTVHVITRDEILRNNYRSLVDALRNVPGIRISQPDVANFGDAFLLRGFFGNYYTKILVDGLPVQPSVAAGMPIGEQLDVKGLDRIEIVYGPTSSLYGADALVGVINLVPFAPGGSYTRVDATLGQSGYLNTSLFSSHTFDAGGRPGRWSAYAVFGARDDLDVKDGYPDLYDPAQYGGPAGPAALGDLPMSSASAGVSLVLGDLRLTLDHLQRRAPSSLGLNTYQYAYDDPVAHWGESIDRLTAHYQRQVKDVTLDGALSYLRYRLDNHSYFAFSYGGLDAYKFEASDDVLLEQIARWKPSAKMEVMGGVSIEHSGALPKTNDLEEPFDRHDYHPFGRATAPPDPLFGLFGYNPLRYDNYAAFAQVTRTTGDSTVIAGLRIDDHSEYGSSLSPRIAVRRELGDSTTLRASYATAFRAPSPYYSYNSIAVMREGEDGSTKINYISIPNPELGPERLRAFEAGVRHVLSPSVSAELVGYAYRLRGLISVTTVPVDPVLYPNSYRPDADRAGMFVNDGESTLYGLELTATLNRLLARGTLHSVLSATFSTGHEDLPLDGGRIDTFRQAPRWLAKLGTTYSSTAGFGVNVDATYCTGWYSRAISNVTEYQDPRLHIDGYFVLDANLWVDLSDRWSATVRVNNVLDEAFAGIEAWGSSTELRYIPQLGRSVYIGLARVWEAAR